MIPIQTVLALLTVLLLVGCSQVAPPRPLHDRQIQEKSQGSPQPGKADPSGATPSPTPSDEGRQTVQGNEPKGKPGGKYDFPAGVSLAPADDTLWKGRIGGIDAQNLYLASQIKPEEGTALKIGQHYRCQVRPRGDFQCEFAFHPVTGELIPYMAVEAIQTSEEYALLKPAKEVRGIHLNLNQNPSPDANDPDKRVDSPWFTIVLTGAPAQTLYRTLLGPNFEGEVQKLRLPNTPAEDKSVVMRKAGKQIECLRLVVSYPGETLDETSDSSYSCWMYGNLGTGTFVEILK